MTGRLIMLNTAVAMASTAKYLKWMSFKHGFTSPLGESRLQIEVSVFESDASQMSSEPQRDYREDDRRHCIIDISDKPTDSKKQEKPTKYNQAHHR